MTRLGIAPPGVATAVEIKTRTAVAGSLSISSCDASTGPQRGGQDPDDVGLARRNREHPPAARADQNGWVRPLNWFRKRIQFRYRVKAAGEREGPGVEQPLEYLERLRET